MLYRLVCPKPEQCHNGLIETAIISSLEMIFLEFGFISIVQKSYHIRDEIFSK